MFCRCWRCWIVHRQSQPFASGCVAPCVSWWIQSQIRTVSICMRLISSCALLCWQSAAMPLQTTSWYTQSSVILTQLTSQKEPNVRPSFFIFRISSSLGHCSIGNFAISSLNSVTPGLITFHHWLRQAINFFEFLWPILLHIASSSFFQEVVFWIKPRWTWWSSRMILLLS